ncbi:hypothetical protein L7F22_013955 [Adiantum nelumboides]|nr:hypothetical protein [Adiantum nelumboides]
MAAAAGGFTVRALGVSQAGTCLTRSRDRHFLHSLAKTGHPLLLLHPRHLQAAQLTVLALAPSSLSSSSLASADGSAPAVSLLDKLRVRKLKDVPTKLTSRSPTKKTMGPSPTGSSAPEAIASSFEDLPLTDELLSAINELGLTQPTEVQCRSIPAVLEGQSVVIASHTGSGKTLAYMIPIVQRLKEDELQQNKVPRAGRPRAVVLCPTRELAEQVFRVSKSICHHAKFRVTLIGGGVRMRPQEDALNGPIDMLVGTPGRVLKHIEDGNVAFGDIKYVILDEADTMFDRGFGPDVKKFLGPLRNRSKKSENAGFQTVLVTATITKKAGGYVLAFKARRQLPFIIISIIQIRSRTRALDKLVIVKVVWAFEDVELVTSVCLR